MVQKVNPLMQMQGMQQMQNGMARGMNNGMNMHQSMNLNQIQMNQMLQQRQYAQQQAQQQQQRNALLQQQQVQQQQAQQAHVQQQMRYQQQRQMQQAQQAQQQRLAANRRQNGGNFNRQQGSPRVDRKQHTPHTPHTQQAQRAKVVNPQQRRTPKESTKPKVQPTKPVTTSQATKVRKSEETNSKKPDPQTTTTTKPTSTTPTASTTTPKSTASTSPKGEPGTPTPKERTTASSTTDSNPGAASESKPQPKPRIEFQFGHADRSKLMRNRNRSSSKNHRAFGGFNGTYANGVGIPNTVPISIPMPLPAVTTPTTPPESVGTVGTLGTAGTVGTVGTGSNADESKDDDSKEHVPLDIVQEEDDEKAHSVGSDERRRIEYEEDMATNPHERKIKECVPFQCHKPKQPGLRANVFVSKECTRELARHIVEEQWGNDFGMLYKYLDYIFRCQIFEHEVKMVTYHYPQAVQPDDSLEEKVVIFHTGLQRRCDHEFLFFVLTPNDAEKRQAEQRWRVPAKELNEYCFSEGELMMPPWGLSDEQLPRRTKFYANNRELLFDDSYPVEVDWTDRLRTNKERIYQELKQKDPTLEKGSMVAELEPVFEEAMQMAKKRAAANPRLTVAQGFVETKNLQKRVELLLPLRIEYPPESGNITTFALALQRMEETKKYQGMSLLTLSMAYANARLVGYVDSSWLGSDSIPKISYAEQKKQRKQEQQEKKRKEEEERARKEEEQRAKEKMNKEADAKRQAQHLQEQQRLKETMTYTMRVRQQAFEEQLAMQRRSYEEMKAHLEKQVREQRQTFQKMIQMYQFQPQQHMVQAQQLQQVQQLQRQQMQMGGFNPRGPQPHQQAMPYGYSANKRRPKATRCGKDEKAAVPFLTSTQTAQGQQRPFIDSASTAPKVDPPAAIKQVISAPTRDVEKLQLNFAMDDMATLAINDDILFQDMEPLSASLQAKGFALTKDTEKELNRVKISQSENVTSKYRVMRKEYTPRSRRLAWPNDLKHLDSMYRENKIAKRNTSDVRGLQDMIACDGDGDAIFLLQLTCLAQDFGPNSLRQLFPATLELESVHLVVEDQMALIRFGEESQLKQALEYVQRQGSLFEKWKPQSTDDGSYLRFNDGEIVWQFQDSNRWTPCHPAMGQLIEEQQNSTFQIIVHDTEQPQTKYFIEKYNGSMGRQTNLRTSNQRPIRRVQIKAWAQPGDDVQTEPSDEEKAIDIYIGMPVEDAPGPVPEPIKKTTDKELKEVPTAAAVESKEVVMNEKWKLQTADGDVWETMATLCVDDEVKEIETAWRWTGSSPIAPGLEKHRDLLLYIPEPDDAVEVLENGSFEEGDDSDARQINITLCATVEKAIELNTFADECDDDGNVQVFACHVVLDEEQRKELEEEDSCTVTNARHIELWACASINLEKLRAANPLDD